MTAPNQIQQKTQSNKDPFLDLFLKYRVLNDVYSQDKKESFLAIHLLKSMDQEQEKNPNFYTSLNLLPEIIQSLEIFNTEFDIDILKEFLQNIEPRSEDHKYITKISDYNLSSVLTNPESIINYYETETQTIQKIILSEAEYEQTKAQKELAEKQKKKEKRKTQNITKTQEILEEIKKIRTEAIKENQAFKVKLITDTAGFVHERAIKPTARKAGEAIKNSKAYQNFQNGAIAKAGKAVKQFNENAVGNTLSGTLAILQNKKLRKIPGMKNIRKYLNIKRKKKKSIVRLITDIIGKTGGLISKGVNFLTDIPGSIKRTIGNITNFALTKTGIKGAWNSITTSAPIKTVVRSFNTAGSAIKLANHAIGGLKTGALWSVLATPLVLANPALLLPIMAAGTTIGTFRNIFNAAYNMDLKHFKPNTLFSNNNKISFFDKWRINIARQNPLINGGLDVSDIKGIGAIDDAIRIGINKTPGKFIPRIGSFLNSLDGMALGISLGYLLGGGTVTGALIGGSIGLGGSYLYRRGMEKILLNLQNNPVLRQLLKFPGLDVFNVLQSAPTVSRYFNGLKKGFINGFTDGDFLFYKNSQFGLMSIPAFVNFAFDTITTIGYASSLAAISNYTMNLVTKIFPTILQAGATLTMPIRIAAIIPTLLYLAGGMAGLWSITAGGFIATSIVGVGLAAGISTGLGIYATIAGAQLTAGPFSLILFTGEAIGFAVLKVTGTFDKFANWIDNTFFPRGMDISMAISSIMGIVGMYQLVKQFQDFLNGTIRSISDYAKTTGILFTAISVSMSLNTINQNLAEVTDQPIPENNQKTAYKEIKKTNKILSNYKIPPIYISDKNKIPEDAKHIDEFDIEREGKIINIQKFKIDNQIIIYQTIQTNLAISKY